MRDSHHIRHEQKTRHRRSIRLKEYDYSRAGAYFVTVCVKGRECILGDVRAGKAVLSPVGVVVRRCWEDIPDHFESAMLDAFVIMPNHLHGVIILNDGRGVQLNAPTRAAIHGAHAVARKQSDFYSLISPRRDTLSVIVRTYKAAVTTQCCRERCHFPGWQRNYYEHIIRSEKALNRIREYVAYNAFEWEFDRENPGRVPDGTYDSKWSDFHRLVYGKAKR